MKLLSLTMCMGADEVAATYVNPDDISLITTKHGPTGYPPIHGRIHFKNGEVLNVKETPKEIALLIGGIVTPSNKVKRYRLRRDAAKKVNEKVWNMPSNEILEDVLDDMNREDAILHDEYPGCEIGCTCEMCEGFREAMEKDD